MEHEKQISWGLGMGKRGVSGGFDRMGHCGFFGLLFFGQCFWPSCLDGEFGIRGGFAADRGKIPSRA
jgi:hypothetical protein